MNGQKFVYKFVSFPEIVKAESKLPYSSKFRKENSDDGSDLAEEEDMPPSPTLSNSPPPSMVANLKREVNENDYRSYLMNWNTHSQSQTHHLDNAKTKKRLIYDSHNDSSSPATQRQPFSATDRQRERASPLSSHDSWRLRDETSDSSPQAPQSLPLNRNTAQNFSLGMSSAMAAAFAFTAASFSEEEQARRAAATAAFLDGFRQATASFGLQTKFSEDTPSTGGRSAGEKSCLVCVIDSNKYVICCRMLFIGDQLLKVPSQLVRSHAIC